MKKRLYFKVHGYNNKEIERRALHIISEYLDVAPEDVEKLCDLELEVSAKSQLDETEGKISPTPTFLGKVYARIK
jgi:hypothetical protein